MESTDSSPRSQHPNLPPGFRFHPTDEELVVHYLKKRATSSPLPVAIIAEVDLYKFDPWELPAKATFGEQEWYFFSPRDRKYPNGARPNRAATSGYWKATGTDKPVFTSGGTQKVGVKKALVFYGGKPPKGIKTNWIMHEYRLAENKVSNRPPGFDLGNKKNSLRLDDWVLCRIYKKNNTGRSSSLMDHEKDDSSSMDDMMMIGHVPSSIMVGGQQSFPHMMMHHQSNTLFDGINNNNGGVGGGGPADMEYSLKRSLSMVNWTADDEVATATVAAAMSKRFQRGHDQNQRGVADGNANDDHDDGGSMVRTCHHGNGNSLAALLSQMPAQTPPLPQPQQGIMGSLGVGDGIFRSQYQLPAGLNWYS